MKAVILAAGYATRLYPLTQHLPKSLLKVAGKEILGYILGKLEEVESIDEIFIVTNHRFYDQFRIWLNHHASSKKLKLIDDGTISNEERLGAIGDLHFVLREEDISDHVLVIAGDNLFGFSLSKFVNFFHQRNKSVVAFHDLKDREKIRRKYGVGVIFKDRLQDFEEKPWEPKSTLAATACYLFAKHDLPLVEKSVEAGKIDNLGDFIRFLVKKSEVCGFVFTEPWHDIGSVESLQEVEKFYESSHPRRGI